MGIRVGRLYAPGSSRGKEERSPETPCQSWPDAWFDPELGYYNRAQELCNTVCPIRKACLQRAMTTEGSKHRVNRYGIAGGLTSNQRYNLYLKSTNNKENSSE